MTNILQDRAPMKAAQAPGEPLDLLNGLIQYLGWVGKTTSIDQLTEGLPVTQAEFGVDDVRRAMLRIGFASKVHTLRRIKARDLPACVKMTDGRWLTVLRKEEAEYVIAHPALQGSFWKRTEQEMEQDYAGQYIVAAPTVEALEEKRIGVKDPGHWFWRHLFAQKWITIEIFVATMVANLLAIAVSLFALQVYDRVIPNASLQTLWVLAVGSYIAIAFEVILRVSRGKLIDDLGRQAELASSAELVTRLQGMRLNERKAGPAALGSLMRDFSSVREFFTATAAGSLVDMPFVVIYLCLIYLIGGPVVWVVIIAIGLIVILSLFSRRTMGRISNEMQGANSTQSRLINEITYGAEAIKLNRAENKFQSSWEDHTEIISAKTQKMRAASSWLSHVSQGFQQVAYVSVVVAGVYMVISGEFTVGAIIAISILSSRTIAPVTQLSSAIARWQQVKTALNGLTTITDARQERDHRRQYARRDLLLGNTEIEGLKFAYGLDQDPVLNIGTFSVVAGETMAILGRNGSGKSTLLKILSGLYDFDSGDIKFDGLEVRQIDPVDLRRNIGFLTQDIALFSGTLRENLNLGPTPATEEQIDAALAFCGLKSMVQKHPLGMDMRVSDGGVGLSVGQRQSLGLARIFLADPQIVLLDEPTAAMDQSLEREVVENLKQWLKGRTCLLTTHRTEIVSLCDKITVLEAGRIVMSGPRDEVLAKLRSNKHNVDKS